MERRLAAALTAKFCQHRDPDLRRFRGRDRDGHALRAERVRDEGGRNLLKGNMHMAARMAARMAPCGSRSRAAGGPWAG